MAQKRKIRKTSSLTPPQPLSLVLERQGMALLCQNLHLLRKQEEEGMEGAGQDGWMDLEDTHEETKALQGQAHLGLIDRRDEQRLVLLE